MELNRRTYFAPRLHKILKLLMVDFSFFQHIYITFLYECISLPNCSTESFEFYIKYKGSLMTISNTLHWLPDIKFILHNSNKDVHNLRLQFIMWFYEIPCNVIAYKNVLHNCQSFKENLFLILIRKLSSN